LIFVFELDFVIVLAPELFYFDEAKLQLKNLE